VLCLDAAIGDEVQHRNPKHEHCRKHRVVALRIVAMKCRRKRAEIERIAGQTRGKTDVLVDRQRGYRARQLADPIGPDQPFLALEAEHPRQSARCYQLGYAEADGEPAERPC
jgi:hypothetical protein